MAARKAIPFEGTDVGLSFLPLSHIFERMAGHYLMFAHGHVDRVRRVDRHGAAQHAEKCGRRSCSRCRGSTRRCTRACSRTRSPGGAVKKKIFFWARGVADRWADEKLAGREPGGLLGVQYGIAQKLVFSKLKARTGGRLRYFVSGGAPLAPEINKFFYAAGLVILEGYGLTETSPVIAVNTPDDVPHRHRRQADRRRRGEDRRRRRDPHARARTS